MRVFRQDMCSELAFRLQSHAAVSIQWDPNLGTEFLSQGQDGALRTLVALPVVLCLRLGEKMPRRVEQNLHPPTDVPQNAGDSVTPPPTHAHSTSGREEQKLFEV